MAGPSPARSRRSRPAIATARRRLSKPSSQTCRTTPDALNAIGVLGLQLGDPQRALAPLVRAVERNPRAPAVRCHLAIAYRSLARPDLAIAELEAALALDPSLAEAHSNLGNLLLERNDNEAAEASFARALALRPDYPFALFGLGEARLAQQRARGGVRGFRARAGARSFVSRGAVQPFARPFRGRGRAGARRRSGFRIARRGRECRHRARKHRRGAVARPRQSGVLGAVRALRQGIRPPSSSRLAHPRPAVPRARPRRGRSGASRAADREPRGDASRCRRIVAPAGRSRRDGRAAVAGRERRRARPSRRRAAAAPARGGRRAESLRGAARRPRASRGLLAGVRDGARRPRPRCRCPRSSAMAHQCHATEYVHDETDEEVAGVADCATPSRRREPQAPRCRSTGTRFTPAIARSHTLDDAEAIADELAPTVLALARDAADPRAAGGSGALRGTIAAMTDVVDDVSAAVRSQYEANPYPRWLRVERDVAPTSVAGFLRSLFPAANLAGIPDAPARILVAGCGTGRHPIGTARRFPDSSVLAVDLSLDEPRVRGAQDARARHRQHRVPAGGHPRARRARRALRCRRLHRGAASPRGPGRGLADPLLAAASGRRDARRAVQRARAPPRGART